ncbi:hypothetical protein DX910_14635 [Acinetobacter haemolyticus]|nr:hypothetical protein DX910_14635 [Acinetobacter haemolyticus]
MSSILRNGRDRKTPRRDLGLIVLKVKADAVIHAGFIVCVDATGFAVEGQATDDLIYMGRAETFIDNTDGLDGDAEIVVRTNSAFLYDNSATDPVDQSSIGQACFIEDGQTVAKTDAAATLSKAGRVVGVDNDGVWIE